jgi:lysophospholipase L1-like esterase
MTTRQPSAWSRLLALAGLGLGAAPVACAGQGPIRASDPLIAIMGRVDRRDPSRVRVGYPGVTFRVRLDGTALGMRAASTSGDSRVAVLVDGREPRVVRLPRREADVVLVEGLPPGPHTVDVVHRTETWQGIVTVRSFAARAGGRLLPPPAWPDRRMLFIGDSVTCGEAIDRDDTAGAADVPTTSNGYLSYGMVLARALGAQAHLVCFGGRGLTRDWRGNSRVLKAPQLFELAVPEEAARAAWDHAAYQPDVVVVSIGTNDFNLALGALPARDVFVSAYVTFVRAIRARHPRAQILLTEGAIVNDDADPQRPQKTVLRGYIDDTVRLAADPAVRAAPARHYPGDARNPHPTREQHAAMARDLEPIVRELTGWRR